MKDYDWSTYYIEGNVEMHEYLEFKCKPKQYEIIEYLQTYLGTLIRFSIVRSPEEAEELELSYPVTLDAKLIIGDTTYSSENTESFISAIFDELPTANGFIIDSICNGGLHEFFNDEPDENGVGRINMIRKDAVWTGAGMIDKLEYFKRHDKFIYRSLQYYPDAENLLAHVIENGKSPEVRDCLSPDILRDKDLKINCDGLTIFINGEKGILEYPELFEELKGLVREISYGDINWCEEVWDPKSIEYLEDCVMMNQSIKASTIGEIEAVFEKFNKLLAQYKDELQFHVNDVNLEDPTMNCAENILYNIDNLTLAIIELRNGELHLKGAKW